MAARKLKEHCKIYQADSLYRALESNYEFSAVDSVTKSLYTSLVNHLCEIIPDTYVVDTHDPSL